MKTIVVTADESLLEKITDQYKKLLATIAENGWEHRRFSAIKHGASIESMRDWLEQYCTTGRYFWDIIDITAGAKYSDAHGNIYRGGVDYIYFEREEDAFYWDMTWLGD